MTTRRMRNKTKNKMKNKRKTRGGMNVVKTPVGNVVEGEVGNVVEGEVGNVDGKKLPNKLNDNANTAAIVTTVNNIIQYLDKKFPQPSIVPNEAETLSPESAASMQEKSIASGNFR